MSLESLLLLRFEWMIGLIIIVLFILSLADVDKKPKRFIHIVNTLLAINLIVGFLPLSDGVLFQEFFKTNHLIALQKNIINLGLLLISMASVHWIAWSRKGIEFYILILSSVMGIDVMLSGGHILTLFLGMELSTLPLTALASFDKEKKKSAEAGLKYVFSSAFSTAISLFGISLLYGAEGNLSFSHIQANLHPSMLSTVAILFILSGFAFKLSAVPFHLWAADVYEGSPTPVTNYLSVVSKASVIFILLTVLYVLFGQFQTLWLYVIGIMAVLSMTIGNLFAMRQQNLKRFLAFSSISQMGFVLVGVSGVSKLSIDSVIFFVIIYMVSNIAMFSIVQAVATATGKENISDFKGFYQSNRKYALVFAISLFSLAGVPPTAGFFGKLFLLTSGMGSGAWWLLSIAAANLVFSLYNYLRVIRTMFIDQADEPMETLKPELSRDLVLVVCFIGIIALTFAGDLFRSIDTLSIIK